MKVTTSSRRLITLLAILFLLVPLSRTTVVPVHAGSVCPAIGADSDCGVIITVTDSGATVSTTGQGPYDGTEDTLIGVVNNSSQPIHALGLLSGMTVFDFDGDGIDRYGAPGNAQDSTGYGGPNAYFSAISADLMSGTVNFVSPVASQGGTAYFSLEMSIAAAVSCRSVLNKGLQKPVLSDNGRRIDADFTPNMGYTLAQAAQLCGFKDFDWVQKVRVPRPSPYYTKGGTNLVGLFTDPPPGGYRGEPAALNTYPYYWGPSLPVTNDFSLAAHQTATTLDFSDRPGDMCLPGGSGKGCFGKTAPAGSKLMFSTRLVGIQQNNAPYDVKIGFQWTDTFNGSVGGISVLTNLQPIDPGSGTGGIAVTEVDDVTDYDYQGVMVTTVNGAPVNTGDSTPPTITPSVSGTLGTNGWYVSDVGVQWNVDDPDSAVSATSGCDPTTITTDTAGTTLTCSATSAGGTSSQSVMIKRDATPPLVTYDMHPSVYTIDQQVSIGCVPTDNLSGVASSTCQAINGPAWSFGPGSHTFSAAAVDQAGNTGGGSATFAVMATFASQCALTRVFDTSPTQAMGMCKVLSYAQAAVSRGDAKLKQTYITVYLKIVKVALAESYLTANQGAVLMQFANTL